MLKYLWDPANAITITGLLFSSASLFFALSDRLELSVAAALWAVLSDHLDGFVGIQMSQEWERASTGLRISSMEPLCLRQLWYKSAKLHKSRLRPQPLYW